MRIVADPREIMCIVPSHLVQHCFESDDLHQIRRHEQKLVHFYRGIVGDVLSQEISKYGIVFLLTPKVYLCKNGNHIIYSC